MAVVRGSKQPRMIVVPYRPWLKVAVSLAVLVVLFALAAVSFWYGQYQGQTVRVEAVTERDRLKAKLAAQTKEVNQLRQQVANLSLGAEVDRQASEGVRHEVLRLKSEIAVLKQDISFYRGLMLPAGNDRGLTIGSLNVISTGVSRQYEYKLVVQQLAARHSVLNGTLQFNIVGRQGEQLVTLPLKDVSDNVTTENIKLRFKYFQTLEGRINLPESFEPEKIELIAKSSGNTPKVVEKTFGWLVQEG
jgi:cell division protein FtsB